MLYYDVRSAPKDKHYSEATGKLHIPCPYRQQTGIIVHVVVMGGYCYRSDDCMMFSCKFNRLQSDIVTVLSVAW
jgi:hypothetical protein